MGVSAVLAGCGGSSTPAFVKLTSATLCSQYLDAARTVQAADHVRFDGVALSGTEANGLWSMCNSDVNGLRQNPAVSSLTNLVQTYCDQWLGMSNAQRISLAQAVSGTVNLVLRVRGETGVCTNDPPSIRTTDSAADGLLQIASSYPEAVSVDLAKLPTTTSPDDPDQCNERTASAPGSSNAQWVADGLADCVAMGY